MHLQKALNYKVIFPLETKRIIAFRIGDGPLLVAISPGKAIHWEGEQVCQREGRGADFIYFKSPHMSLGKKGRRSRKMCWDWMSRWYSTN